MKTYQHVLLGLSSRSWLRIPLGVLVLLASIVLGTALAMWISIEALTSIIAVAAFGAGVFLGSRLVLWILPYEYPRWALTITSDGLKLIPPKSSQALTVSKNWRIVKDGVDFLRCLDQSGQGQRIPKNYVAQAMDASATDLDSHPTVSREWFQIREVNGQIAFCAMEVVGVSYGSHARLVVKETLWPATVQR